MTSRKTAAPPLRPERLRTRFSRTGDSASVSWRLRGERGAGCFLLLWLTGWTVGCLFLAAEAIREPKVFTFLFAVPFWASWVFVFALILKSFFQREALSLDHDGARYVKRVLIPLSVRHVPLDEVRRFATSRSAEARAITMRTAGQALTMFDG